MIRATAGGEQEHVPQRGSISLPSYGGASAVPGIVIATPSASTPVFVAASQVGDRHWFSGAGAAAGVIPPAAAVASMSVVYGVKSVASAAPPRVPYIIVDSRSFSVSSACITLASIRLIACSLPLFCASSRPEMMIVAYN